MKNWKIYLIFFAVLLCFFWIMLYNFTDWFNQTKLAKRNTVQPFNFINQDSASFTNADMLGKVCVVEYFFTTCESVCPEMNGNMQKIYKEFKSNDEFLIVSHTCKPEEDSVPLLRAYSKQIKADNLHWVFITGSKNNLYNMARFSYGIDDPKNVVNNIEDDFIHSQFFALIDKNGNVRGGVYDGLKQDEIEKLKVDIRGLLKEKSNNNFTGVFTN